MGNALGIEHIPIIADRIYSLIARKVPPLRDLHKEVAQEVADWLSTGRILDVGTGPGYLPLEIAKRSKTLEIVGIDLAPGMVKIAYKNAKAMGLTKRVKFHIGNAAALPFDNASFDFIVSTLSMHHWSRPTKCLKEIGRALKKNGEAWIYEFRSDTAKEVHAQLKARYGSFTSFLLLNFVRAHSSMSLRQVEDILSSLGPTFQKASVEDRGVIMKLRLVKSKRSPGHYRN